MLTSLWHQLLVSFFRNVAAVSPEALAFQKLRWTRHLYPHCVNHTMNSHEGLDGRPLG